MWDGNCLLFCALRALTFDCSALQCKLKFNDKSIMPSGNHNEAFSQSFNKVISSHFSSLTFYLLKEGEFTSHKHWVIFQTSKIKCFHHAMSIRDFHCEVQKLHEP